MYFVPERTESSKSRNTYTVPNLPARSILAREGNFKLMIPDSATLRPGYIEQVAWMERSGIRGQ